MNEVTKTLAFAVAAVVAVVLGICSHLGPSMTGATQQHVAGTSLFAELKPEAAKSLEIIEYDAETATPKLFKVAQEKGLWRIPSHEDYPADASQQLGEAAAALVACEIINIESEDRSSHVTYGVVDPDPKSLAAGATGVGKRVVMEDGSGKKLAQVIIGKGIKDKPDLHYVRVPDQDPVYVVKLKTDKFSTKFEDWIEKDLLKLNSWDVQTVSFNDYSIDELQQSLDFRSKIQLEFDNKDSKWKLNELEVFNRETHDFESQELAGDEELNSQKLNDLKSAVDELKIVDVRRKPQGLAANLRAGEELTKDREAVTSLMQRGFYLAKLGDEESSSIYSNEGEVRCGTKEGVEYTLRFGRIAAGAESETKSEEGEESADSGKDEKDEKKETGANRFIMVSVEFKEDLLEKPQLAAMPGEQPAKEAVETEGVETEGKETPKDGAQTSAIDAPLSDAEGQLAQADDGGEPTPQQKADKKRNTDLINDAISAQNGAKGEKPAPAKPDQKAAKGESKSGDKKPDLAKPKTPEELERERIAKENERKQKEYDDKVKRGQDKVKELSDRFADWYYIVSDSTYQKIHLGRDEIIKKKTPPADANKDEHGHEEGDDAVLKNEVKTLPE